MSHCMFIEVGCLVNAGSSCTCACSECRTVRDRSARDEALARVASWCPHPEDRREGFALDSQAGQLIEVDWCRACGAFRDGGVSEDWLYPVTHAALARIKSLEGGIVAENRRVVAEHNMLRERIRELEELSAINEAGCDRALEQIETATTVCEGLQIALAAVEVERAQLNKQVTDIQRRCTELLEEKRRAHVDYAAREFHLKYGHPAPGQLTIPGDAMIRFRLRLVAEEFLELVDATFKFRTGILLASLRGQLATLIESVPVDVDLVEFMDATHDLDYVVAGTRVVFGYDGAPGAAEVHRSNMEKIPNGLGKPTKPEGWKPPDIEGVLRRQGYRG